MGILDTIVTVSIVIVYNLFTHMVMTSLFKGKPYKMRNANTITGLFVTGIVGLVLANLFLKNNDVLKKGLNIGGIMLILTAGIANWNNINEDIKIFLTGATFMALVWLSYKQTNKEK